SKALTHDFDGDKGKLQVRARAFNNESFLSARHGDFLKTTGTWAIPETSVEATQREQLARELTDESNPGYSAALTALEGLEKALGDLGLPRRAVEVATGRT